MAVGHRRHPHPVEAGQGLLAAGPLVAACATLPQPRADQRRDITRLSAPTMTFSSTVRLSSSAPSGRCARGRDRRPRGPGRGCSRGRRARAARPRPRPASTRPRGRSSCPSVRADQPAQAAPGNRERDTVDGAHAHRRRPRDRRSQQDVVVAHRRSTAAIIVVPAPGRVRAPAPSGDRRWLRRSRSLRPTSCSRPRMPRDA